MKKAALFIVALMILGLFPVNVSALAWAVDKCQWVDTANGQITQELGTSIQIDNGESLTLTTGPIYSMDPNVEITVTIYDGIGYTGDSNELFQQTYTTDIIVADLIQINPEDYNSQLGTYTVLVKAEDAHTTKSNWDTPLTFTVNEVEVPNEAPTADFTFNPISPDEGQIVQFTSTSTDVDGTITNYIWDFGDLANSAAQNPPHIYVNDGTYTVTLTVEDNDGASDSVTKMITVNDVVNPQNNCPGNVNFNFAPASPAIGEQVMFTASATDQDGDALTYSWDFDYNGVFNQDASTQSATISYNSAGTYTVALIVSDGECTTLPFTKDIVVTGGYLNIGSLECFDPIIVGKTQSCSIGVKTLQGFAEPGVTIKLFYEDGSYIGTCSTLLAGKCQVKYTENTLGQRTVYATAEKSGFAPDLSQALKFTYTVIEEAYQIQNLNTYATFPDMVNDISEDTFYRGVPLYVKFQVWDMNTNALVNDPDVVTEAWLVSMAGGMVELTKLNAPQDWYYYRLELIPLTHEFYSDSQAFAFAFKFADEITGGQEYVDLQILNNPPSIVGLGDTIVVPNFNLNTLNLEPYESDLEDNEDPGVQDNMYWEVDASSALFTAEIVGKELHILPTGQSGHDQITLRLKDYDNYMNLEQTYAEKVVMVSVAEQNTLNADILAQPTVGEAPLNVAYSSTVNGGVEPYSYEWNFGDNSGLAASASGTHVYTQPGNYIITLTVKDTMGNGAVDTQAITVTSEALSANILVDGVDKDILDTEVGVQHFFTSSVTGGFGALNYKWAVVKDNIDLFNSEEDSLNYIFNEVGTYKVLFGVQDSLGNIALDAVTVNVYSQDFTVRIVPTTTGGGVPLTVGFVPEVQGGSGGALEYTWGITNSADGSVVYTSNDASISYTFEQPDDYVVDLKVMDEFGKVAVDSVIIHAQPDQDVVVVIKAVPQSGYAPLEVKFSVDVISGNEPFTYYWDLGDGSKETSKAFTHVFEEMGVYEVTLKVTDGDNDVGEAKVTINVKDTKTPTTPSKVVDWTSLKLVNGEVYNPGDSMPVMINFKNMANWDMESVRVTFVVPELGIKRSVGPFDLLQGHEATKVVDLEVPFYAAPGEYDLRVIINTDGDDKIHRIKHRRIIIE